MTTTKTPTPLARSRTMTRLTREFAEAHDAAAEPSKVLKGAKKAVKDHVDKSGETSFANEYAVVRFQSRNVFDTARFKKEHPKLHAQFMRESVSMVINRAAGSSGK